MVRVIIELPAVLVPVIGRETVPLDCGPTVASAFDAIRDKEPRLAVHLFDEEGGLREHVLCFHNGVNTRWLDSLETPLADGDRLTVMQAVSGG